MQLTNLIQERSQAVRRAALAALVISAFLSLPVAADPYQPVRAIVVAIAVVLAALAGHTELRSIPRWVVGAVVGLAAWYALAAILGEPASSLWGVHGRFQAVLSLALALAAGLAGWMAFRDETRWLARIAAVAAAVQGFVVIYQVSAGALPTGTIGNRALLGAWLAVVSTGAIVSWRMERGWFRWLALGCAVVGAVGLGLAGSRGGWIAFAVGVAVVVIAGGIKKGWPLIALGAVLVVAALGLGGESAYKLDPGSLLEGSASSRFEIWRDTSEMIADNPVAGVGPGRYLYEFPQYQSVEHAQAEALDTRPDTAHSYVLQMASEAGIPAAMLLITLAGAALWGGVRGVRSKDPAALAALAMFAAYLAQAVFGIGTVEIDALGWMLGGVLIGMLAKSAPIPRESWFRVGTALAGAVIAVMAGYYLIGDISHGQGLDAFAEARFDDAWEQHSSAVSANPLVDVYRVGQSDTALYLGGTANADAIASVERGLELEPMSYDLALARARLMSASGAPTKDVADAYLDAVELYPLGVGVRLETAAVLLQDFRTSEARRMAEDVLAIVEDEPTALAILEATSSE